MTKSILITGATDGIGLAAAELLAARGHRVLLHGRNPRKLEAARDKIGGGASVETFLADLSRLSDVAAFADAVAARRDPLDVVINNAGVFKTADVVTAEGFDTRFAVNTFAPYLLTERLSGRLGGSGRVINLSSAAQAPVSLDALRGRVRLSDPMAAYAQSKLALTMWSRDLGRARSADQPEIIALNPGSLIGTKMVRDGFGVSGQDLSVGAEIMAQAALDPAFEGASGRYFDNDAGRFADPHRDALDPKKTQAVTEAVAAIAARV